MNFIVTVKEFAQFFRFVHALYSGLDMKLMQFGLVLFGLVLLIIHTVIGQTYCATGFIGIGIVLALLHTVDMLSVKCLL